MKRLTHSEMRGGSESQVVVVVVVVVHWLLLSDLVLQCNHQPQLTTHSRRQLPDKAWEQVEHCRMFRETLCRFGVVNVLCL